MKRLSVLALCRLVTCFSPNSSWYRFLNPSPHFRRISPTQLYFFFLDKCHTGLRRCDLPSLHSFCLFVSPCSLSWHHKHLVDSFVAPRDKHTNVCFGTKTISKLRVYFVSPAKTKGTAEMRGSRHTSKTPSKIIFHMCAAVWEKAEVFGEISEMDVTSLLHPYRRTAGDPLPSKEELITICHYSCVPAKLLHW